MAKYLIKRGGVVMPNGRVHASGVFDAGEMGMEERDVQRYITAKKIVAAADKDAVTIKPEPNEPHVPFKYEDKAPENKMDSGAKDKRK